MAQLHRGEGQIELKCHADKFFDVWAHKPHHVPKICPNVVTNVEVIQGNLEEAGAVICWSYYLSDMNQHASFKTTVEEIDDSNKFVRYSYHDGFMMSNYYKSFKSKIQAIPKAKGCIVKWSFEYEKMNEDAPEPSMYVEYMLALGLDVVKNIGSHLCDE